MKSLFGTNAKEANDEIKHLEYLSNLSSFILETFKAKIKVKLVI